jgi:hypothetical protein
MKDQVTVTDITTEAKSILKKMNPCQKYYDNKFVSERTAYWMSLGFNEETATKKANEDLEWSK